MINLAAALNRRKLQKQSGSISRGNVNTTKECFFYKLHNDLLFNILIRLPVDMLMKLKLVCKYWMYLIKHSKSFMGLQFTWSKTRLLDEPTFLIYPTCYVEGFIPIKRFSFNRKDLRFKDTIDHESSYASAVVASNHVTVNERKMLMLEPVNGLVCFVKGGDRAVGHCSVLIYNPSTREKSAWIDTLTSAAFRKLFGLKPLKECHANRLKSSCEYMFGFGIDPNTNQHKVIFITEITFARTCPIRQVIISRELICGVFTVGEYAWRKVGQVPPDAAIKRDYVHVCGSIYWSPHNGVVMVFDLRSETFRSIKLPNFIPDSQSRIEKKQLLHGLAEVDGHLAMLFGEADDILNLWIYTADNVSIDTDDYWIKETLQLPYHWDKVHDLTFKAIAGTSLIIMKLLREMRYGHQFRCEILRCYDRREQKYYENSFEVLLEPSGTVNGNYSITPFFDTLLPLQTIQHVEIKKQAPAHRYPLRESNRDNEQVHNGINSVCRLFNNSPATTKFLFLFYHVAKAVPCASFYVSSLNINP